MLDYHEDAVDDERYRWKGCWGCHYFTEGQDFPYLFVEEAALAIGVSETTIRKWIRAGKLEGYLFEQSRRTGTLPSPRKYHILKESVKKF